MRSRIEIVKKIFQFQEPCFKNLYSRRIYCLQNPFDSNDFSNYMGLNYIGSNYRGSNYKCSNYMGSSHRSPTKEFKYV